MTSESGLAFVALDDRAAATPGAPAPADRISVRDYVLEADIGAFQTERGAPQTLRFNVVVEVATLAGKLGDDVDLVLSYDTITDAIAEALADLRLNLLETLAERIAELILLDPRATRIFIRIEKMDRGPFALGVEIVRARDDAAAITHAAPPAQVAYMSANALQSETLAAWLDVLSRSEPPTVLVVAEDPDARAPQTSHSMAGRRIGLLALEQAAWVLAGRDDRCLVVNSRTEIDWALRQNQMTVWAPSKLVLDATPETRPAKLDSLSLAGWLAQRLEATRLLVIGLDDGPELGQTPPLKVQCFPDGGPVAL